MRWSFPTNNVYFRTKNKHFWLRMVIFEQKTVNVFESHKILFYTSWKFWTSDFSNLSPADDVSMSFYVDFFRKIIFKMIWFGLWQNFKCMAKFENSRWPWWSWDRIIQWDFEIFDDFERYETQIKSITNWIWFEIALIYWKPLFECNWSKF